MRRYTFNNGASVGWLNDAGRHFCSEGCCSKGKPCDLCLMQRRKQDDDLAFAEGRPTLKHNPFEALLKGRI